MRNESMDRSIRYSESFKQQVVLEIESGLFTVTEAMHRYCITGKMTIYKWLRRYGRDSKNGRIVRVETKNDQDLVKKLKDEIHLLREALAETQLDRLCSETHLEVALEYLTDEQKKTALSRLSPAQRRMLERNRNRRP